VQLIVDEAGRSASALTALARTPISGIQVDRAFVAAACSDPQAEKICRATFGIAAAFGVQALANGIDTQEHYDAFVRMGCELGSGDFFAKRANPT
jgi:EAL domain-containing protein (putative c-di-GMP-specific phosphodiesterase class I)